MKYPTNTKEFRNKMESYILDCIESEETELKTPKDKVNYAYNRFLSEFWHKYEQINHKNSIQSGFASYLMGLPFHVDFENYKILELAKNHFNSYKDVSGMTPKQIERYENKIIANWFNLVSFHFLRLHTKYNQQV